MTPVAYILFVSLIIFIHWGDDECQDAGAGSPRRLLTCFAFAANCKYVHPVTRSICTFEEKRA